MKWYEHIPYLAFSSVSTEVSFWSIKYLIDATTNNNIALLKLNDRDVIDEVRITTCLLESNRPFTKYFEDKDIPNYIDEINKLCKRFSENDQFWWCYRRKYKKHNANWSKIPDYSYKTWIIGSEASGKAITILNLMILMKFIYTLTIHVKQNINC